METGVTHKVWSEKELISLPGGYVKELAQCLLKSYSNTQIVLPLAPSIKAQHVLYAVARGSRLRI